MGENDSVPQCSNIVGEGKVKCKDTESILRIEERDRDKKVKAEGIGSKINIENIFFSRRKCFKIVKPTKNKINFTQS